MKSERRHELQQNSLVRAIENFPAFWKEQGSKIALGLIAVALVVVLIRLWYTSRTEKAERIAQGLSYAESQLGDIDDPTLLFGPPESAEKRLATAKNAISDAVNAVMNDSDDPAQKAQARVIQADLNYQLASLARRPVPGATTRPELQGQLVKDKPDDLMDKAAKAYTEITKDASMPPAIVARAHFGLAAINENRGHWIEARDSYEAIAKDARVGKAMQSLANFRLERLKELETPPLLGHFKKPPELPATKPARKVATQPSDFELGPPLPEAIPSTGPATPGATTLPAASGPSPEPQPALASPASGPAAPPSATGPATQPATSTAP